MKLGIVGSGMIVRDLLSFIHDVKGIELIHISGTQRSEEQLRDICEKHHFKRYSTNYDDLLNDVDVDTIYVALPNHLHFEYTKRALQYNKHVILEKPLTSTIEEARELKELAISKQLFLWEAVTNQYLPNYNKIKKLLPTLGQIKIVECNYSQYSSRYNAFKEGNILPAFDYTKSGGALMDLNIYNIHFVVGLFGKPHDVHYYPNIQKNIEESLSFITITRQQKKNIPLVGRTIMKQQIMVLDSLQKWCIEFKQEIENEESLEKMQELGGE